MSKFMVVVFWGNVLGLVLNLAVGQYRWAILNGACALIGLFQFKETKL